MEFVGHLLAFTSGLLLYLATVAAVVTGMLVPRPGTARVSNFANMLASRLSRAIANQCRTYVSRDAVLAISAPTSILLQLFVFVVFFIVAIALMLLGVSDLGAADSFYQSGATLLTLGIVEPVNAAQVVLTFIAAFTGLVVIAVLIGYLLMLYSAYTPRESAIAQLSLLAGEPAWGPELLCRATMLAGPDGPQINVERWIDWASDVKLNQTMNPVLNHFRSAGPYRSWLVSLTAVLDAAALQTSVVKGAQVSSELVRLLAEGSQTLAMLRFNEVAQTGTTMSRRTVHRNESVVTRRPTSASAQDAAIEAITRDSRVLVGVPLVEAQPDTEIGPGISRQEWDHACDLMSRAGIELMTDRDRAWEHFAAIRARYAGNVYHLARQLSVVRAPWTGSRIPETDVIWPTLAVDCLPTSPTDAD